MTQYVIVERLELPEFCIEECSHSGSCDADVALWVKDRQVSALLDTIPVDDIRDCLRGYGAWSAEELTDDDQNRERLLWIMCSNFKEDEDYIFCVE